MLNYEWSVKTGHVIKNDAGTHVATIWYDVPSRRFTVTAHHLGHTEAHAAFRDLEAAKYRVLSDYLEAERAWRDLGGEELARIHDAQG